MILAEYRKSPKFKNQCIKHPFPQYTYSVWGRSVLQRMHPPHDLQSEARDNILQYAFTAVATDTSLKQLLQLNRELIARQINDLIEGGKSSGGYDHAKAILILFVGLHGGMYVEYFVVM